MASHNAYAVYKRHNRYLLQWMINTSNSIIRRLSAKEPLNDALPSINSTGKTTVADLVGMSRMIANHISPIPTIIYRLLKSVIKARVAAYTFFVKATADSQSPTLEKQNASHKHFIEALEEILQILGGENWSEDEASAEHIDDESVEQAILANKFTVLHLDGADDAQAESDGSEIQQTQGKRQSRTKAPKGNRKSKLKKKRDQQPDKFQDPLQLLPLESYRIIEDSEGTVTEYLVAAVGLLTECASLRTSVKDVWRDVAYNGEHIAVAGAVSNAAIAIAKRTSSALFADFPEHDSFETVIHTTSCGRNINEPWRCLITVHTLSRNQGITKTEIETMDAREHFSIYTYLDLLDFIHDFQKTGSGRPTKRMLKQIAHWHPNADLQQLSWEKKILWRRSFTINWLYDLTNTFLDFADNIHSLHKECGKLRTEPNNADLRLFQVPLYGLNEFAGFIASLAGKRYGTDVTSKILPYHVFQLQCVVDSMTVSRGWSASSYGEDIVSPPPEGFVARRDLDIFLDTSCDYSGLGYLPLSAIMMRYLSEDEYHWYDVWSRASYPLAALDILHRCLEQHLGRKSTIYKNHAASPSRFADTNPHGLWDYSPFSCGVGLLEALELAYLASMIAWTNTPEVLILMHLYNKLVQKGYINTPIEMFEFCLREFSQDIFADGQRPTSDFMPCFMAIMRITCREMAGSKGQFSSLRLFCFNGGRLWAGDFRSSFEPMSRAIFRRRPFTHHLRAADWDIERIPAENIPIPSRVAEMRLCRKLYDAPDNLSAEDKRQLDCLYRNGATKADVANLVSQWASYKSEPMQSVAESGTQPQTLAERLQYAKKCAFRRTFANDMTCHDTLCLIRHEVKQEVHGGNPVLGINHLTFSTHLKQRYDLIIEKLKELKNPLYERAFCGPMAENTGSRLLLARLALKLDDEECLRTMANILEDAPIFIVPYWGQVLDQDE